MSSDFSDKPPKFSEEDIIWFSIQKLIDEGYEAQRSISSVLRSLFIVLPSSAIAIHTVATYMPSITKLAAVGIIGILLIVYVQVSQLAIYMDWLGVRLVELESKLAGGSISYFRREIVLEQSRTSLGYKLSSIFFLQKTYKSWSMYLHFFVFLIFSFIGEAVIFGIFIAYPQYMIWPEVIFMGVVWPLMIWIIPAVGLKFNMPEIKGLKKDLVKEAISTTD